MVVLEVCSEGPLIVVCVVCVLGMLGELAGVFSGLPSDLIRVRMLLAL